MKPILLCTVAAVALSLSPALAQQADEDFVPGVAFLTNWDADEDGKVTLDELMERRDDVFLAFDENEDGALSADEFATLDEARTGSMQRPDDRGNGAGRGEQALSFDAADTDADGSVSLEEFQRASAGWMDVMDRNGDGVLTADDFGPGAQPGRPAQNQRAGQGQRQGQAMGQPQARGQGQGPGQAQRQGQGQGKGQGQGQGMGRQNQMQIPQSGMGAQQGYGQDRGQGHGRQGNRYQGNDQRGGKNGGQGQQGGQGMGRGQQAAPFEAIPAADGTLWVVDARTGDILACRAVADGSAAAGFVPVCVEVGM